MNPMNPFDTAQHTNNTGSRNVNRHKHQKSACNLLVAGLSKETTNTDLRKLFSPFGPLLSAMIMMDYRTGMSRGFGFVLFERERDANQAIRAMHLQRLPEGGGGRLRIVPSLHGSQAVISDTIFIRHVPAALTRSHVTSLFEFFGHIIKLSIHTIPGNDMVAQAGGNFFGGFQALHNTPPLQFSRVSPERSLKDGRQFAAVGIRVQFSSVEESRNALEALHGSSTIGPLTIRPHSWFHSELPIGLELGLVENKRQLEAYDVDYYEAQLVTTCEERITLNLLKPLLVKYEDPSITAQRQRFEWKRYQINSTAPEPQHVPTLIGTSTARTSNRTSHIHSWNPPVYTPEDKEEKPVVYAGLFPMKSNGYREPCSPAIPPAVMAAALAAASAEDTAGTTENDELFSTVPPYFSESSSPTLSPIPVLTPEDPQVTSPETSPHQLSESIPSNLLTWIPSLTDCEATITTNQ